MNKFRIGDTVETLVNGLDNIKGARGKVMSLEQTGGKNVYVVFGTCNKEETGQYYSENELELVITPEEVSKGVCDVALCRNVRYYNYNHDAEDDVNANYVFKELNIDMCPKEFIDEESAYDIMALYRKEGYNLIKLWERKKELTKEERLMQQLLLLKNTQVKNSEWFDERIDKAIQILKEQGE